MGQFTGYIKPNLTIGYRPSVEDIENAIQHIEHGLFADVLLRESSLFSVAVGIGEYNWYSDLTDAILSPDVFTSDLSTVDSTHAVLRVLDGSSVVFKFEGVFKKAKYSEAVVTSAEDVLKKEVLTSKTSRGSKQSQEFLDELSTVLDEESLSSEVVTWNTPNELRKYLTRVSNPIDVFSDVSTVPQHVAQSITSANKREIIPYQYLENGDMVLNPDGAVLLKPYLENLGFVGLASGVSETERLDIATAVLARILYKGSTSSEYSFDEAPLLYSVVSNGMQKGIYPKIEHDNKYNLDEKLPYGYLVDSLSALVVDKKIVSVNVLVFILSFIIEHKLFGAIENGFPYLNSEISRKWVAELFEFGG